MTDNQIPVVAGHPYTGTGTEFVNIAFAPGSIFEAFKAWVESQGLELTPPMRFGDDENEIPTQFLILTKAAIAEVWADGPANQEVSKLGQEEA